MTCRILLSGATGAMGRAIAGLAGTDPDFEITVSISRSSSLPEFPRVDALIDFSTPEQTRRCLEWCRVHEIPLVIGTTGLDDQDHRAVREAAGVIPVCVEANFSVGVHLLYGLVEHAAGVLGDDFDAEVLEIHHRRKVDAPSGTALSLADILARTGKTTAVTDRAGHSGARKPEEVSLASLRGGDVAGEHTVFFLGDGERIELSHRASSREIFARGALRAAGMLAGQESGLHGFSDLLLTGPGHRRD